MINKLGKGSSLFAGFDRLQKFPLDKDTVKKSLEEIKKGISSGVSYEGEFIYCIQDKATYVVSRNESSEFTPVKISDGNDLIKINNTIKEKIAAVNRSIDELNGTLDSFNNSNKETFAALNKKIEENKKACDDGLAAVRASVGENTKLIEANEKAIESSKAELQNNIKSLENNLSKHIDNYTEKIKALSDAIDENKSKIVVANANIETLQTAKKTLDEKFSNIESWKSETEGFLKTVITQEKFNEQIQQIDLKNYYSKEEIDKLFTNKLNDVNKKIEDLSSELTKKIDEKINNALQKLSGVYKYKGTKETINDLPLTGNEDGDVWNVNSNGMNYAWSDNHWDALGSTINLDGYATEDWVKLQNYSKLTDTDVRTIVNEIINLNLKAYKTSEDLAKEYYSKADVDKKITDAITGGTIDLSNYYTKEEVDNKIKNFDYGSVITKITGGNAASWKNE